MLSFPRDMAMSPVTLISPSWQTAMLLEARVYKDSTRKREVVALRRRNMGMGLDCCTAASEQPNSSIPSLDEFILGHT